MSVWVRWVISTVSTVGLVQAATVSAEVEAPEVLVPISPWHVDWAKTSCGLRRVFGKSDEPLLLQFEQFEPGSSFQLTLTGKRLRPSSSHAKFSVRYGTAGVHDVPLYRSGAAKDGATTIFIANSQLSGVPNANSSLRAASEYEAAINQIFITQGRTQFVLATGSLGRPFAELHNCTEQLIASWGLDPATQLGRSRAPVPTSNPGTWVKGRDYPAGALVTGSQSIINFRLTVGEDGMPTDCEVQSSYSGELFEHRTCQLLMSVRGSNPR
jgi:hypothetical protein